MQHWDYINIQASCPKLCMNTWLSIAVGDVERKFKFWHILLFLKWSISFKINYFSSKVKITGFTVLGFKKIRNLLIPLTVPENILTLFPTLQMVLPLYKPFTDSARELNNTMASKQIASTMNRRKVFSRQFLQEAIEKGPDILQKSSCSCKISENISASSCMSASQTFWSHLSLYYLCIFFFFSFFLFFFFSFRRMGWWGVGG